VPLDPGYPTERLQYMLADAAPEGAAEAAPAVRAPGVGAKACAVVELARGVCGRKSAWATGEPGESEARQGLGLRSSHLAYVIYTSGVHRRRPKGVMVEHRSVINRLQWMQQAYQLGDGRKRFCKRPPAGFDVSVWEFFLATDVWGTVWSWPVPAAIKTRVICRT